MVFLGAAGSAVTAIILRGLVGSAPHLAVKTAARFTDSLCVIDDASDPRGPAGGPFDAEGWPTLRRTLAQRGELAVDPALWGRPSRVLGPHGLSWRRDLARPPVLAPSNVALVSETQPETNSSGSEAWIANLKRGFVCDSVTIGALSFDVGTGVFAVPCSGRLVRGGEVTERRVRGVLQGSVAELAAGIVDVRPVPGYTPLACGIRKTDVFVAHGVSLQSG
ncbi:metallopeptidase TldD-related protein [Actinomyces ruminicola]|uniref:metallopeptidase TldD-related protein n=1 Tax=Actinomyces ruminicola TaxID=332524 RepID=UPI0037C18F0C